MTDAYAAMLDEMAKNGFLKDEKPFDFSYHHLNEIFDQFLEFGDYFLQAQAKKHQYPPCYLYIVSDIGPNAYAVSTPDYKKIAFHSDAIELLYYYFTQKEAILEGEGLEDVQELLCPFNNPLSYAFFQYFQLYLFYHEYAHLVQRGSATKFSQMEFTGEAPEDVLESHARELDADWLSAAVLANHIYQRCADAEGQLKVDAAKELMGFTSIALTAIFCWFMKTAGYYENLYFMKHEHPHPYVRLVWISINMVHIISEAAPGISFNPVACVHRALDIAEILMEGDYKNPNSTFYTAFSQHLEEIIQHVQTVAAKIANMPELCQNKGNEYLP
jgi:hypothetical protein